MARCGEVSSSCSDSHEALWLPSAPAPSAVGGLFVDILGLLAIPQFVDFRRLRIVAGGLSDFSKASYWPELPLSSLEDPRFS